MSDDIRRWSEELAREPGSMVFLPLGDALRRRGQLEHAQKIATRGLERHPYDADAHDLLARIWADRGDVERAMDEWSAALQIAPTHAGALKGMGFAYFHAGRHVEAEQYLVAAAAAEPDDLTIVAALDRVRDTRVAHSGAIAGNGAASNGAEGHGAANRAVDAIDAIDAVGHDVDTAATGTEPAPAETAEGPMVAPDDVFGDDYGGANVAGASVAGGARAVFADVVGDGEQTALLLDGQGFVLAGSYVVADGREVAQEVGGALTGVSDEARRAMRHLGLGEWQSLVFEAEAATVAMAPIAIGAEDGVALVAAARSVPLGLVRRLLLSVGERAAAWLAGSMARGGDGT